MNKKLMKLSCLVSVLALMFSIFTGCGSTGSGGQTTSTSTQQVSTAASNETSSTQANKTPVKLTLWNATVEGVDNGYKAAIAAYKELYPNVSIEFSSFPPDNNTYDTKLKTAFAGGTGPDMYFTNGWNNLQVYVDAGNAAALDGKVDLSMFENDAIEIGKINGKIYGTPGATAQYLTVYYNKDLFAKAGVNVPKTYAEFISVSDTLKSKNITPIAIGGQENLPYLFTYLIIGQAMAPDYFADLRSGKANSYKDPRHLKIINSMVDWGKKGYFQKNFNGTTYAAEKILFATEKATMLFTGTWDYAEIIKQNPNIKLGAFAFPGDSKVYGIRVAGSGLSINSKSANEAEAVKFVNYTVSKDGLKLQLDAQKGIPLGKGMDIADPFMKEVATAPEYANFFNIQMNLAGVNNSGPQAVFQDNILNVTNNKMTVEQFADLMDKSWDPAKYVMLFK